MAYDPTLPENNAPIVSAELRNQFAGLNELIAARAPRVDSMSPVSLTISDPPTQGEVQVILDTLNDLINLLHDP